MNYILHRCNDMTRLKQGLNDPAINGLEIDFFIENGQVMIGHGGCDNKSNNRLTIHDLRNFYQDAEKILVVDLKDHDALIAWNLEDSIQILAVLHQTLPERLPFFVTGLVTNWNALVRQTINTWNVRHVTYFVDPINLHACQHNFQALGIRFGLNLGTTVLPRFLGYLAVPLGLRASEKTKEFGTVAVVCSVGAFLFEAITWALADVRMIWTITSSAQEEALKGLNADYLIIEPF